MSKKDRKNRIPRIAGEPVAFDRQPHAGADIPRQRTPKALPDTNSHRGDYVVVRWSLLDLGGPWCLTNINQRHHADLLRLLGSVEKMTAVEVFSGNPGKDYSLASGLPNAAATQRLHDIARDDLDQISRLSVGGEPRLYGFRRRHEFFALWWDPDHKIWPSKLKHT